MTNSNSKIILCGGAGLVGMNLVQRLIQQGYKNICVIDKHKNNLEILNKYYPSVICVEGDLSRHGKWESYFEGAEILVMLQAQIGGNNLADFKNNNVESTKIILSNFKKFSLKRLVHVSSSVLESTADDYYTQTKEQQEAIIKSSGIKCPILRPTLMFGWFDRKHLGWLSRFMKKVPIFPVPGNGKYVRQPLYVGDFCKIIISCIENYDLNGIYNISGRQKIYYIDLISQIKKSICSKTVIIKIPYNFFYVLLNLLIIIKILLIWSMCFCNSLWLIKLLKQEEE